MASLRQDVRDGLRALRTTPVISATIVCIVAVVVGGNTAVFGLVHAVLTRPARGVMAQELVTIQRLEPGESARPFHQYSDFEILRESARTLRSLVAVRQEPMALRIGSITDAIRAASVTPNYFDLFGVRLVHGTAFAGREYLLDDAALPVVISEPLWRSHFHGRPDVIGQPLYVNDLPATVTGVAPAAFRGATLGELTDVWVPLRGLAHVTDGEAVLLGTRPSVQLFGQLANGQSLRSAQAELSVLIDASHRDVPHGSRPVGVVVPYSVTSAGDSLIALAAPRFLLVFSGVTALTLIVVCANIMILVWSRTASRQQEVGIRLALGATRRHLIRAAAAEAVLLGVLGLAGAGVFAAIAIRSIVRFLDARAGGALAVVDFSQAPSTIAYAAVLTFLTVLVSALGPSAFRSSPALIAVIGKPASTRRRSTLSRVLVVGQLALSVTVVVIGGLAYRSVSAAQAADLGFSLERLLLVRVGTDGDRGNGHSAAVRERVRESLQGIAGIEAVSYADTTPAVRGRRATVSTSAAVLPVGVDRFGIGPGFFRMLDTVPWQGREFLADDATHGRPVAIVNRSLAQKLWPGAPNVIGQSLLLHDEVDRQVQVVAVVPDVRVNGPRSPSAPASLFIPQQSSPRGMDPTTFYVRHEAGAHEVALQIRRSLAQAEPRLTVVSITNMTEAIDTLTGPQRMIAALAMLFAAGSLLISAVGLHGMVAFDVKQRMREFGVRQAIGGSRADLLRLVLADALALMLVGLVVGCLLGAAVGATGRTYLYGVTPADVRTYAAIVAIVTVVTLAAVCGPALKASRVDPLVVLRAD